MNQPEGTQKPSEDPFPIFASLAEAQAYSDRTNDPYFELCYHLEGDLNLCLNTIHDLYANAPAAKRPKMQTGLVREILCPDGWPKHPKTMTATLIACARFRHEDTCHAYTVDEAMMGLVMEKQHEGTMRGCDFDRRTLEPITQVDADNARRDWLRLCDWIESRLHWGIHRDWYRAPDCFSDHPDKAHLANIGIAQRHLGKFSERDRKRWGSIHENAAAKHSADLKTWGVVGKVQHDPEPRTWTHPEVDAHIISLWPLVARYNWTHPDLLKVLDKLLPISRDGNERHYPLDSVESLKVHCRTFCGLTKSIKGKSADGLPNGWQVAEQLCRSVGK